eukprot:CAMPEP_0184490324 /NCGR_PEP_ID=MMETSP0113_2-20130426/17611_1 /TAXON_ID=91329 /ORGANISM="Norrisiella sphaerica, Strain BC52" /LENGTH=371 /DNA_ID=CAMNT_0026874159 /DNA_START=20 /DNA_END=1135 /DNA_ORIENTATION=+
MTMETDWSERLSETLRKRLPPHFWFHMSNKGVRPSHPVSKCSKVVFLHGWCQSHSAWLQTATKIRDRYGHESILLDFYGHGSSPYPDEFDQLSPEILLMQVRDAICRVGWENDKIVFAAISLGASIGLRYAESFPGSVERFLLLAPSGLKEPFMLNLANLGSVMAKAGVRIGKTMRHIGLGAALKAPPIFRGLAHMNLIKSTPHYDVPQDLGHVTGIPFTVLLGQLDFIHTPQASKWCEAGDKPNNRTIVKNLESHVTMCLRPTRFRLEELVGAWHSKDFELEGKQLSPPSASHRHGYHTPYPSLVSQSGTEKDCKETRRSRVSMYNRRGGGRSSSDTDVMSNNDEDGGDDGTDHQKPKQTPTRVRVRARL